MREKYNNVLSTSIEADTDILVKPKYRPMYRSISNSMCQALICLSIFFCVEKQYIALLYLGSCNDWLYLCNISLKKNNTSLKMCIEVTRIDLLTLLRTAMPLWWLGLCLVLNPSKKAENLRFSEKIQAFPGLNFLGVMLRVVEGWGIFGWCHQILRKNLKVQFLRFFFQENEAKIQIFRVLDWPSSISGWQVMAKK